MLNIKTCSVAVFLTLSVAACDHTDKTEQLEKSNFFGSDAAISPFETKLVIGGIYTTIGNPKKLVSGARIDQFCDKDTEYYNPKTDTSGILVTSAEETIDGGALLKIGATQFPGFSAAFSAGADKKGVYKIENATRTRLVNSEVRNEELLSKIGSSCKKYIKMYQRQGRDVFVLLEGYKVENIEGSIAKKFNVEAGVTVEVAGKKSSPIDGNINNLFEKKMKARNVFIEVSGYLIGRNDI